MSNLLDCVVGVARACVQFAESQLLSGEQPLDAAGFHASNVPADESSRLLTELLRAEPAPRAWEYGEPPIPADRRTHSYASELLWDLFPRCAVAGEEATTEEWAAAEAAAPGSLIFCVDAIDGSVQYDSLGFGYSTNVLAFRRTDQGSELLVSVIATSSHYVAAYEHPGLGLIGSFDAADDVEDVAPHAVLRPVTEPLCRDLRGNVVALGAASRRQKTRKGVQELILDQDLTVFTTGGAPAGVGLVLGRLDALVSTAPQAAHDAAALPLLAHLGIPIFARNADGSAAVLGMGDVLNLLRHFAIRPGAGDEKPLPPYVVARQPELGGRLAQLLF